MKRNVYFIQDRIDTCFDGIYSYSRDGYGLIAFIKDTPIGCIYTDRGRRYGSEEWYYYYGVSLVKHTKNNKGRYDWKNSLGHYDTILNAKLALKKYVEDNMEEYEVQKECKSSRQSLKMISGEENKDFYPTPNELAGKMLSYIQDWENVFSILEPSAGKGDLVDTICSLLRRKNKIHTHYGEADYDNRFVELNVIEKDPNLQLLLRGKGLRLVHDDFLTFYSGMRYDLIVMNPPFSEGDKHLMKAIDLIKNGGQVVCLLNAETIRNPYTNLRKDLAIKLAKYNAKIEFISGAFKKAEIPTDVEIALVYINIPKKERKSEIFEKMKKAEDERFQKKVKEGNSLVSNDWVEQLVSMFNVEMQSGIALIDAYEDLKPYIMSGDDSYSYPLISLNVNDHDDDLCRRYLRGVRYKYWKLLFDKDEMKQIMTSKMREDYFNKLKDLQNYDFTNENIEMFIGDIKLQLESGVKESILALFDKLSCEHAWYPECKDNIHYYNGWATNKAHKIGNKVIIPFHGIQNNSWRTDKSIIELETYQIYSLISDLERAMNYLDCGETVFKTNVQRAIDDADRAGQTTIDFTWFTTKFYKKGTCHIKFKPEAERIIERLNIFAGKNKNWLPPDYGKKMYSDMTDEEKTVIDEFQGEEAYNEVMAEPSKFILEGNQVNIPLLN